MYISTVPNLFTITTIIVNVPNKKPFAIPLMVLLVLLASSNAETAFQTALSLRIGDGAAAGITFDAFPGWIVRGEALGRLGIFTNPASGEQKTLLKHTLGGQGTLFRQITIRKAGCVRFGPALEVSFVHNELIPTEATNADSNIHEGIAVTPWIAAAAGYQVLPRLELFIDTQISPYGYYT